MKAKKHKSRTARNIRLTKAERRLLGDLLMYFQWWSLPGGPRAMTPLWRRLSGGMASPYGAAVIPCPKDQQQ